METNTGTLCREIRKISNENLFLNLWNLENRSSLVNKSRVADFINIGNQLICFYPSH